VIEIRVSRIIWEFKKAWKLQSSLLSLRIIGLEEILLLAFENFLGLLSWFFLSGVVTMQMLDKYRTDFLSYILLGILFNEIVTGGTFFGFVGALFRFVYSSEFKRLIMSKTNPILFLIVSRVFIRKFLMTLYRAGTQALIIFLVFHPAIDYSRLPISIVILLLAFLVNMCFSTIIQIPILKYPRLVYTGNPFARSISLLSALVAGIYFPIEILPQLLQYFSFIFPNSSAILAVRYYLAGDSNYINYLYALTIQAIIYGLFAYILSKNIIKDVQKRGFVKVPLV